MKILLFSVILWMISISFTLANNIMVEKPKISDQNLEENYVYIQFDLSWENSWRTEEEPNNWDAAWIFIKYKDLNGLWKHASLSNNSDEHILGSISNLGTIETVQDGKGVFVYRSSEGFGKFETKKMKLKWEYGLDGITDNLKEVIQSYKIFAIEMVNVPEGQYYLSDGTSDYRLHQGNNVNNPILINSENPIRLGNDNSNSLWGKGSWDYPQNGTILSASYPKGFKRFYCMKYEISQEQYVDFLNTLTREQQSFIVETDISQGIEKVDSVFVLTNTKSPKFRNSIRCNENIDPHAPVYFYNDLNNNGTPNEDNDGQYLACNYLNWQNAYLYADWAALRPMTELEFEKACRGTLQPVPLEYAWGTTNRIEASQVENIGKFNEIVNTGNCNFKDSPNYGVLRTGIFAKPNSDRESSGGSYYGIMELSGNVWEICISVGNSSGRLFEGNNGDGDLTTTPNSWANFQNCSGSGMRGGSWDFYGTICQVSDRLSADSPITFRNQFFGFRAVR